MAIVIVKPKPTITPSSISIKPEESKGQESVLVLAQRFARRWDTDGDGNVTNDEFMDRVSDPMVQGEEAVTLATLIRFQRAQGKNWSGPYPALSLATLRECAEDHSVVACLERRQAFSTDRLARSSEQLFSSNGRIQTESRSMKQFLPPQCTFHAALFAVAAREPERISKIINDCGDSGYEVKFPGWEQPQSVNPPTDTERILLSNALEDGLWLTVLEKAWGQRYGGGVGSTLQTPGLASEAIAALSGQVAHEHRLGVADLKDTERLQPLWQALDNGGPVVAQTDETKMPGLTAWHAYTLISHDADTQTVRLRNSLLTGEPLSADGTPLDGIEDGLFEMPLSEFVEHFASVIYPSQAQKACGSRIP